MTSRHWLFSLLALLVLVLVPVAACYVGWAIRWQKQRAAFLNTHDIMATAWDSTGGPPFPISFLESHDGGRRKEIIVGFVGKLGDPISPDQQHELEIARALFPEAAVNGYIWIEPSVSVTIIRSKDPPTPATGLPPGNSPADQADAPVP